MIDLLRLFNSHPFPSLPHTHVHAHPSHLDQQPISRFWCTRDVGPYVPDWSEAAPEWGKLWDDAQQGIHMAEEKERESKDRQTQATAKREVQSPKCVKNYNITHQEHRR
jgi:hypothetical protein